MWRAAILTLSDKGTRGEREDTSGPAIRRMMEKVPARVLVYDILPDERERIEKRLISLADGGEIDLILTTGGTGVGPRDVAPEATLRSALSNSPPVREISPNPRLP